MPKLSEKSRKLLSNAHPDLRKVFEEVIKYIDFTVIETTRTEEQHNENVKNGVSKTTWDKSKHRPRLDNEGRMTSWAIDAVPYPIDWNNIARFNYFAGFVMGTAERFLSIGKITHHIRWGGDWNKDNDPSNEKFYDAAHFEIME